MDADEYREYFMEEGCAVLALALHERTGYDLAVLFDDGSYDDWGRGSEPTPAHCFVIDPANNQAVDGKGRRELAEIKDDFFDLSEPRIESVDVAVLRALMGDDRPMYAADAETWAWAQAAIVELRLR